MIVDAGPLLALFNPADRHHQACVALCRNANMRRAKASDDLGFVVVAYVDLREIAQGYDHRPYQKRQQGQLAAAFAPLLIELGTQFFECCDVHFLDIAEVRRAAFGVLHALGDFAAQADYRDLLFIIAFGVTAGRRDAGAGVLCQVSIQVVMQHTSGRAAADHKTQLDPGIPGALAHGRGGQWAFIGFAGDRCSP